MEFIETDELLLALDSRRFFLIDGSYFADVDSKQKHFETRIHGALFFDLKTIRDTTDSHPMRLPTLQQFSVAMRKLRLNNDGTQIVLYDQTGMFGVGRVWWMLKYYGFTAEIKVLKGGLPKWVAEGKPTESGEYQLDGEDEDPTTYKFAVNPFMLVTLQELRTMLPGIQSGESQVQLWDSRPDKQFAEGSIPGNIHIVYRQLLDEHWCFKSKEEVIAILTAQGLDLKRPVVTQCRSGVVASLCYALLKYIGKDDVKLYGGSWLEYAAAQS